MGRRAALHLRMLSKRWQHLQGGGEGWWGWQCQRGRGVQDENPGGGTAGQAAPRQCPLAFGARWIFPKLSPCSPEKAWGCTTLEGNGGWRSAPLAAGR